MSSDKYPFQNSGSRWSIAVAQKQRRYFSFPSSLFPPSLTTTIYKQGSASIHSIPQINILLLLLTSIIVNNTTSRSIMENNCSSPRRVIEFTVLSGEDMRIDRRLIKKKNVFTIVHTDASDYHLTTKVDESGGSYPSWNEKFVLELPMHSRFINLQVQCKASSSSFSSSSPPRNGNNKTVGSAKIPVSDFIGGYVPENYLHFLSYRLRDAKGEKNGIINVSVRVKVSPQQATASNNNSSSKPPRPTLQGYAPACSSQGYASYSLPVVGGVVTGIPVWCANRA